MKKKNGWLAAAVLCILGVAGHFLHLPPAVSASFSDWLNRAAVAGEAASPQHNREYGGRVVAVHDGDTVRVRDTDGQVHKVRLANIDAPEIDQRDGINSRDHLRTLILSQNVEVRLTGRDSYRRDVGTVYLNGRDINLAQVESGWAWHYTSIAKRQQNAEEFARYLNAQDNARQQRLGLWHNGGAVPPWRFRHSRNGQNSSQDNPENHDF